MDDNRDKLIVILIIGIIFILFGGLGFMTWLSDRHEEKMAEMGYIQKVDAGVKLWVKE